jgi:ABC-type sugar transport system ATPase subunit
MYREPANVFAAEFIGSPKMNLLDGALAEDGRTARLAPPDAVSRTVMVGVRPEDWTLASGAADAVAEATVSLVETIGRDTLLRADIGGVPIRLYAPHETGITAGSRILLGVRPGKAHLFDKASGLRLPGAFDLQEGVSGP